MTTIVKLPASPDRRARPADLKGGATILFFTGVRYVRDIDAELDLIDEAPDHSQPPAPAEERATLAFV